MRGSRRTLVTAIVLAAFALLPGRSAAAETPTLTVTPSTELTQGQIIQISVSDDTQPARVLGQCRPDANLTSILAAQSHCQLITFALDGSDISTDWAVPRLLSVSAGDYDCGAGGCQVVYSSGGSFLGEIVHQVTHPLTFAAAPFVVLGQTTQLIDDQEVEVTVEAVPVGATATLVQCVVESAPLPDGAPGGCTEVGTTAPGAGVLSGTATVRRDIPDSAGVLTDCQRTQCALGARVDDVGPSTYLTTHITFRIGGIATFDPERDLVDGQRVAVSAANLPRFDHGTTVVQCRFFFDIPFGSSNCAPTDAPVDDVERSTYEGAFTVRRFFTSADGTEHDCARQDPGYLCSFFVAGRNGPEPDAPLVLHTFDFVFFRQIPALVVDPATDLGIADEVDFVIDEPTTDPAFVGVCARAALVRTIADAEQKCDGAAVAPHGAPHTVTRTVPRSFAAPAGFVDCARVVCEAVYLSAPTPEETAPTFFRHPLTFAKGADFGFFLTAPEGDPVRVQLEGYPGGPGLTAVVGLCGFNGVPAYERFFCRAAGAAETDFDGDFDELVTVQRFIPVPGDDPIDCGVIPARCGLIVFILDGDMVPLANPGAPIGVGPRRP